jgi:MFS family permease
MLPGPIMISNRWAILALLFAVRTGMGVQFQAVPALSPLYIDRFGVSLADIGLLIGLYHAPGIALALPGGAIGQRCGDKPVVVFGLALMVIGGLMVAFLPGWPMQMTGRLIAAVGSILMNILMTKMIADWFAGRELATAMSILVNAWPFGIALGLVVLPRIAASGGLDAALIAVAVFLALGTLAMALFYRSPPSDAVPSPIGLRAVPEGFALKAVVAAGLCWGFFNAAIAMVFSFAPSMLIERGWSLTDAAAMTSVVLWLVAVSVPLGGVLADRSGRPLAVLVGGALAFALALLFASRTSSILAAFVVLGIVAGWPAGPIMALPARVLAPATRAIGMGVFFTCFYAIQLLAPWVAGIAAQRLGTSAVAMDLGAAAIGLGGLALLFYLAFARQAGATVAPTLRRA